MAKNDGVGVAAPTVVVLLGPKGAGKSHLGRLLDRRLGIAFLDVEAIFRAMADPADVATGYATVAQGVDVLLQRQPAVSLELTGAAPPTADLLNTLSRRHTVRLIAVRASLGLCFERIAARDASLHLPADEALIEKVHTLSTALDLDFDLVLENTGISDDELVARVRAVL